MAEKQALQTSLLTLVGAVFEAARYHTLVGNFFSFSIFYPQSNFFMELLITFLILGHYVP